MKKELTKQKKKFLGTVPKKCKFINTFWDCPEISENDNQHKINGITLIALIITIIVMLILVAVTISVALNGGLFTTAKQATNETQYAMDYEILQEAVIAALIEGEGTVTSSSLSNNLPNGWKVSGGTTLTVTSPNGNTFTVATDGTITKVGDSGTTDDTSDLDLLTQYFSIYDLNSLLEVIINGSFTDDPDTIADASTSITFIDYGIQAAYSLFGAGDITGDFHFYVKYKVTEKVYKVSYTMIDEGGTLICTGVELAYEPSGREGTIVEYDSDNDGEKEEWAILYDNGDTYEMISMETMGSVTLGYEDESAQDVGDIDCDGEENTNMDKAIYSYNNAITKLNKYCTNLITNNDIISIRSAGSNPDDPLSENNIFYESDNLLRYYYGLCNGKGKGIDSNLDEDLIRIYYFGVNNVGEEYWMSSRHIMLFFNYAFSLFYVNSEGYLNTGTLWRLGSNSLFGSDDESSAYTYTKGVRPIIKVSADSI